MFIFLRFVVFIYDLLQKTGQKQPFMTLYMFTSGCYDGCFFPNRLIFVNIFLTRYEQIMNV